MFLKKIPDSDSHIPLCLKEEKDLFLKHYIQKNIPYQFLQIHRGARSKNFIFKTEKISLFIKKPLKKIEHIIPTIVRNINLAQHAQIASPKVIHQTMSNTLVLEYLKGKSIASKKIKPFYLNQLWQEYKKFKKIPLNQVHNFPNPSLNTLYDFCQKNLKDLSEYSWMKKFLLQKILKTFLGIKKSEIQYNSQKLQAIHGDFHNNNILFYEEKLSAILDWEELSLGYASEDWLRYTFCLIERLSNYYQRRKKTKIILSFLLSQKTFSKEEWTLGFNEVLLLKINKILRDPHLSLFRLIKMTLFCLFWEREKKWVLEQIKENPPF